MFPYELDERSTFNFVLIESGNVNILTGLVVGMPMRSRMCDFCSNLKTISFF